MQNALAVMLGSNLGTTFSSWIIATVGFKLNIENIAFPLAGIFGITMLLSNKNHLIYKRNIFWHRPAFHGSQFYQEWWYGCHSARLTFLALINTQAIIFYYWVLLLLHYPVEYNHHCYSVKALPHIGAIDLLTATAIVLGSEVGTIIKLMIASANGLAAKKRVALGNCYLILLLPL